MADREEILRIIRQKGPVLPVQIAKEVKTSLLFASAMLSELVSARLLKVSSVKIGGSPLYYIPDQSSRLQEFSKHLPGKEQEAYALLKESKVLRDSSQEPAIRVALKNMKDFAWPLAATINTSKELFWKWYLTTNEEATSVIRQIMGIKDEKEEAAAKPAAAPAEIKEEAKPEEKKEEHTLKKEERKEHQKKHEEKPKEHIHKELPKEEAKKEEKSHDEHSAAAEKKESPAILLENDDFLAGILSYFSKNNINVLSKDIIKKNSEIDFGIELQSSVGSLKYYCKAKSKKKVNEGDLSSAYVQGHLKKLPVLFLSCGDPTKRAKEMLGREFQNIVFKKINGGN